jgi:hypothetical protein
MMPFFYWYILLYFEDKEMLSGRNIFQAKKTYIYFKFQDYYVKNNTKYLHFIKYFCVMGHKNPSFA